jgi:hypothetical protein
MALFSLSMLAISLMAFIEAGYVDLYRDADFKSKMVRVTDVTPDVCYNFRGCSSLDNMATSATWHELPELGSYYHGGDVTVAFYSGKNCSVVRKWWYTKTQRTDSKLHFPSNFRLDKLNDEISSFMVLYKGDKVIANLCTAST